VKRCIVGLACMQVRERRDRACRTRRPAIGDGTASLWFSTISSIKFILRGQYKRRDGRRWGVVELCVANAGRVALLVGRKLMTAGLSKSWRNSNSGGTDSSGPA